MNKKYFLRKCLLAGFSMLFLAKCKVPYDPPIKSSKHHYLVVEGYVTANNSFVPYLQDMTTGGYLLATGTCVDCTLTGSPVKPTFWP